MLVIGFDISTKTGYAVIRDGLLLDYGIVKLKNYTKLKGNIRNVKRFKEFRSKIIELVEKHRPIKIAIEETYIGVNVKTTALLNMLKGVATELIPEDVELISSEVSHARKVVLGKGYKKDQVFLHYIAKYNLDSKTPNDVTDAILLAEYATKPECDRLVIKKPKKKKQEKIKCQEKPKKSKKKK